MKRFNILFLAAMFLSIAAIAQPGEDLPPEGEPGKCYAKCLIPDEWTTATEQRLVKEASTRIEVIPENSKQLLSRL